MPSFVYIGPPDEPHVDGVFNTLTGEWVKGVARDIDDAVSIAWLRRHPHWREVVEGEEPEAPRVIRRRRGE